MREREREGGRKRGERDKEGWSEILERKTE